MTRLYVNELAHEVLDRVRSENLSLKLPKYQALKFFVPDCDTIGASFPVPVLRASVSCAPDLNIEMAEKIEDADLDTDQMALLDKLLGKDYEVITADERLDKIAIDFVEHCATRWESGKVMFVCIDKVTCARMHKLIMPRWKVKAVEVRAAAESVRAQAATTTDDDLRSTLFERAEKMDRQAGWMDETIIEIIISEAQNELPTLRSGTSTSSRTAT